MAELIYPKPIRFPLWASFKEGRKSLRYSSDFSGRISCRITENSDLPLVNHIETSGAQASAIISYMADKRRRGAVVSSLTMFMLTLVNYDSEKMQATLQAGGDIAATYPEVLSMIYILMTLTSTVAFILQCIPMFFYNFGGAFMDKVLGDLKKKREISQNVVEEE